MRALKWLARRRGPAVASDVRLEMPGCERLEVEHFVAQPFVCGALGSDSAGLWSQLISLAPARVIVRHASSAARFAASDSVGLEKTDGGWCWGRYVARPDRPADFTGAADELGLAGFWAHGSSAILHADGLGFQDLFVRTVRDTTYFANRIAPLALLGAESLTVNWPAWLRTFLLLAFAGNETPFAEISRLGAGERLELSKRGVKRATSLPGWLERPEGVGSWSAVAEAIAQAVPNQGRDGLDLTLSGGLDSRLLLAAAQSHAENRIRTWSTHHESGWDGDLRIAQQVAAAGNVPWSEVDYTVDDWRLSRRRALARFEHTAVLHSWLEPLAQTMRARQFPLVDGLGGDVLLRYHSWTPPQQQAVAAERLWQRLGAWRIGSRAILRPDIMRDWIGTFRDEWFRDNERWADHPYSETVRQLLTRTNRGIAASPFRLFAPERQVITPFMDPIVVRAAMDSPPLPDSDRDLRPRLLAMFDPKLAAMESTLDPAAERQIFVERGKGHPLVVQELLSDIRSEPAVAALFADGVLSGAERETHVADPTALALRTGAMMASWLSAWRHRLRSTESVDTSTFREGDS